MRPPSACDYDGSPPALHVGGKTAVCHVAHMSISSIGRPGRLRTAGAMGLFAPFVAGTEQVPVGFVWRGTRAFVTSGLIVLHGVASRCTLPVAGDRGNGFVPLRATCRRRTGDVEWRGRLPRKLRTVLLAERGRGRSAQWVRSAVSRTWPHGRLRRRDCPREGRPGAGGVRDQTIAHTDPVMPAGEKAG